MRAMAGIIAKGTLKKRKREKKHASSGAIQMHVKVRRVITSPDSDTNEAQSETNESSEAQGELAMN